MRVAVDARPAVTADKTGIGYYAWHLLRLLPVVDPASTYKAWYLNPYAVAGARKHFPPRPNFREVRTPIPSSWFEKAAARWDLPRVEWLVRFDVFWPTNAGIPTDRCGRSEGAGWSSVARTDWGAAGRGRRRPGENRCWSGTRSEERVAVVPHGIDTDAFRRAGDQEVSAVRRRHRIDGPFLLYLGGIEPRKNLPRLLEAFGRLDADVRPTLVLAGGWVAWNPEGIDAARAALAELPEEARRRVVMTGYVSDRDKVALLSGAEALVYPSLYEGFGLPVLEAMAVGTPVLTSNVSGLPEVAGDAALLVPPHDVDAIAAGMERLLRAGELRERLAAAGAERVGRFRWEDAARRTAEVLRAAGR